MAATVCQHGAGDSGGTAIRVRQTKDAERRDKVSDRAGENIKHGNAWGPPKTPAMPQSAPLARERKAA